MPQPRAARSPLAATIALTIALALALPTPLQAAKAPSKHRTTVTAALQSLQRTSQITPAEYAHYAGAYSAARRSLTHLSGTRHTELAGVLANVEAMAATKALIPSRLPALFLTLERNREWWTTKYLLAPKSRVSVPGSKLVWEYYPGQGIEIQWLGTFGTANGYYSTHNNTALTELLNEAAPLATHRAGGIAWEYMFQFDGGLPPWTSGLSQGTALQAFSRGWQRLHNQTYLTTAQQALGIFQKPPPEGVRVATPAGAEYAEYTYAPGDRILNGFIQAVIGLYDYTAITQDPLGEQLFEAGDAEARAEVPHYDTGAWSLYDQHEESDLNYHALLTEFLEHLCQRSNGGLPLAPTPAPTPTPAPPPTPTPATGGTATSTTTTTTTSTTTTKTTTPAPTPIPGDQIYCTTGERFQADLHTPPTLEVLSKTLKGGTRSGVRIALSKLAAVSMTIRQGSHVIWSNHATLAGGKPRLLWVTPSKGGIYEVTLSATDLAGNHESTTGTIAVSAAPAAKR
jgi:D-glucuronyl C5-epimerase C-terminus